MKKLILEKMNSFKKFRKTEYGRIYLGDSMKFLKKTKDETFDLIVTSPPYDLIREKEYGNMHGSEYLNWITSFGREFHRVLKQTGSLVMDFGSSWTPGHATKNLYEYRILIKFCDDIGFHLAQDFFWWNPSKLPTPTEWVNKRRIRAKDAVTKIWWFSKSTEPKADNKKILSPYSDAMKKTLREGTNEGRRRSGHVVSKNFQKDNGGSIPPNLIAIANTKSVDPYLEYCLKNKLEAHPARYPRELPEYFIRFLTEEGDNVLDPFAGSCVTGEVCENLKRKWTCCELNESYLKGALARFEKDYQSEIKRRNPISYKIFRPDFSTVYDDSVQMELIPEENKQLNLFEHSEE